MTKAEADLSFVTLLEDVQFFYFVMRYGSMNFSSSRITCSISLIFIAQTIRRVVEMIREIAHINPRTIKVRSLISAMVSQNNDGLLLLFSFFIKNHPSDVDKSILINILCTSSFFQSNVMNIIHYLVSICKF